ncbi:hypothetical protein O1L60_38670 [Streptomyces diastatochromogenes]|nr:hypothetical protein [Streptomyces diastatochromogenes]
MDHLAVVEGGALLIEGRERGLPVVRDRLDFPEEWRVVVVDSGTRKDTGHHIRDVRAQLAAGDPVLAAYRAEADEASGRVWRRCAAGTWWRWGRRCPTPTRPCGTVSGCRRRSWRSCGRWRCAPPVCR